MSLSLQKIGVWINDLYKEVNQLKQENKILKAEMDEMKELVHKTLMKRDPEYKKKVAMGGVEDFLRNRFGERQT